MDFGDSGGAAGDLAGGGDGRMKKPRQLPDDLPKSLDDRKIVSSELIPETEMYDGWQGLSLGDTSTNRVVSLSPSHGTTP